MGAAGAVTAAAFLASSVIGTVGTKSAAVIDALRRSIARWANFPLRGDAFEALYRPVRENILSLMPEHWRDPASKQYLISGLVVAFPAVAFLAYYGVRLIGRLALPARSRRLLGAVLLGATLAPLSLNLVGWDSARWNAICLLASFGCVICLRLFFVPPVAETTGDGGATAGRLRLDGPLTLSLAGIAVVLGLCSSYPGFLFDGYTVEWFPFGAKLDAALDLLTGGAQSLPRM
jgi:hypothetical protein